jgi:hypothetical protein
MRRQFLPVVALVLLGATAAAAQESRSNTADVDQIGDDNTAVIDQTGSRNFAGSETAPLLQSGFWNALDILQRGIGNSVGQTEDGLFQDGALLTSTVFNWIDIDQLSDFNVIGSVLQTARGAVPLGANGLRVLQDGGEGNRVTTIRQVQGAGDARQIMSLRQTGTGNLISLAAQTAATDDRGERNYMRVAITGSFNGTRGLTGVAARPETTVSGVVQEQGTADDRGNGNEVDLTIIGDDNDFGLRQGGRLNSMGLLTIVGAENELGLRQDGDENDIAFSQITGDRNRIGVDQFGTNRVELDTPGDIYSNDVLVLQQGDNGAVLLVAGDRNAVYADQDYLNGLGGTNMLALTVRGDDNFADILQLGRNSLTLSWEGDGNNPGGLYGASPRPRLAEGLFVQIGLDNLAKGLTTGDGNGAALLQRGDGNAATFTVVGDGNGLSLSQEGNANASMVWQNGQANMVNVQQ